MWSLKNLPNPGAARISARRSELTGLALGVKLKVRFVLSFAVVVSIAILPRVTGGLAGTGSVGDRISAAPAADAGASSVGQPGGDRLTDLRCGPGYSDVARGQIGRDGLL